MIVTLRQLPKTSSSISRQEKLEQPVVVDFPIASTSRYLGHIKEFYAFQFSATILLFLSVVVVLASELS